MRLGCSSVRNNIISTNEIERTSEGEAVSGYSSRHLVLRHNDLARKNEILHLLLKACVRVYFRVWHRFSVLHHTICCDLRKNKFDI